MGDRPGSTTADQTLAQHVAALLRELARRRAFLSDNPFRIRAFERAASTVEKLGAEFEARLVRGTLKSVPGLGEGVLGMVDELLRTGEVQDLVAARAQVPDVLLQMVEVGGLTPRQAQQVHRELGIQTLGELEYAAHENRLLRMDGMGPALQDRVLKSLRSGTRRGSCRLEVADASAGELCGALRLLDGVTAALPVGAVRRRCEVVERVDVLVAAASPGNLMERAVSTGMMRQVQALGPNTARFEAAPGVEGTLHAVLPADLPAALLWWTGSTAHILALEPRLTSVRLTADGARTAAGESVPFADESALYGAARVEPAPPPELREDGFYLDHPVHRLVSLEDVQGALHNHTLRSDGRNSVSDMQEAAHALGLSYLGISEHSASATYARGLDDRGLRAQQADLLACASLPGTRLLHGVESDILEDGRLDYPDAVLDTLEFCIASVHARFRQDADRMTARLIRAVSHAAVDVLGHPTGRLLLSREPSAFDVDAVFAACARNGVAVEINGHPQRMDPSPELVRRARRAGAQLLLSADAHSVDALGNLRFAVDVARRAGLTASDVVNTQDGPAVRQWLGRRRRPQGATP